MKPAFTYTYRLYHLLIWILLFIAVPLRADDSDVLNQTIQLSRSKETIYHLLGQVSELSGYLFIYDSKIINNEKVVRIKGGTYTLRQAIYEITGNKLLKLQVIGNHILISESAEVTPLLKPAPVLPKDSSVSFTLEGTLLDKYTNEPIESGTIGVMNTSVGTITNLNGGFRLHLPDSLRSHSIYFSHLGYEPQEIEASLLNGKHSIIALDPRVIPIQEVVVRIINPFRLLREMQEKRKENYSQHPAYLTSFYREGIERKNRFVNLTEAIFKVYKSPYLDNPATDQVKLLKMRRISNQQEKDTLITKMKSGINACLLLDIMKDLPDFLTPDKNENIYTYAPIDITVIDNRLANVIYFEQKEYIDQPLYRGELYIDSENSSLLRARFEIHPNYIAKAIGMLIEKKSRHLKVTSQKVTYTVSYKPWNGTYYINHVRGDLYFKVKKKKQLFGNTPLHTWFEMATCKIDTSQVARFTKNEALSARTIFAETNFVYDESFWGDFNVIPQEEKLNEAISKISSKIEETGY